MNTVLAGVILWVVLAGIFLAYFGVVTMIGRAQRVVAERDWGQRGGVAGGMLTVVLAIFIFVALLFGACAVCVNDDDHDSLGRVQLLAHHHDDQGDDYGDGDGSRQGNGNRQGRCRGDQCRGSFSPGPFDRSPVDVHDNCVSLDCSGEGGKHPPAGGQQPESLGCAVPVPFHCDPAPTSLFPPSPGAVRDFVVNTIKAGIELGQLFANTTISFVENIVIGIA